MKVKVLDKKNVEGADNSTALERLLNADEGNVKNAKGLSFFVKNTSTKRLFFRYGFDLAIPTEKGLDSQRFEQNANSVYQMFNTLTKSEYLQSGYHGIMIPKNFEGYVRIPFTQCVNPSWEDIGAAFNDDHKINYMVINFSSEDFEGCSFIIDAIGYYYTDVALTTTFNKPTNSFTNAMNTKYEVK